MCPKEIARRIKAGRIHLRFCAELYRMQLAAGRHFLHEHPSGASSWQVRQIAQLLDHPKVHSVVSHQCMFGLVSSKADGSQMPSMQPTRFMASSTQMIDQLSCKCDRRHTHRHLEGKLAADAAFYPLELIVSILRGIRDTSDAESNNNEGDQDEHLLHAMNAAGQNVGEDVEDAAGERDDFAAAQTSNKDALPRRDGGTTNIEYDDNNFKQSYFDEYTG